MEGVAERQSRQESADVHPARKGRGEATLQAQIMEALGLEADLRLFRNNVGVATFHGAKVRYGLMPGSGDLIGVLHPTGRFISLEVKTPSGRVRPEQEKWRRMVVRMGGFACVVRSVADARSALARARMGAFE